MQDMPSSRAPKAPPRPSSTSSGSQHRRTSSSISDPLHQRPITGQAPKLRARDLQSPRSAQSEPLSQKKLGNCITDLETQIVQAQRELKSMKKRLASAESTKKQVQEELYKKGRTRQATIRKFQGREKQLPVVGEIQVEDLSDKPENEVLEGVYQETDVFEVPGEKVLVKPNVDPSHRSIDDRNKMTSIGSAVLEPAKTSLCEDFASKDEKVHDFGGKVEGKDNETQASTEENETLKEQLEEAKLLIASAYSKEEELASELNQLRQELEASKANTAKLGNKVIKLEAAKELLEAEMRKMKMQTEQWKKAADAAASVLADGAEMNGRISKRCASMDKNFSSIFEQSIRGYGEHFRSPGAGDDINDSFEGGKKKGSGIRMLGDLLKKKGQK